MDRIQRFSTSSNGETAFISAATAFPRTRQPAITGFVSIAPAARLRRIRNRKYRAPGTSHLHRLTQKARQETQRCHRLLAGSVKRRFTDS